MGIFSWGRKTPDNFYKDAGGNFWTTFDSKIEDLSFDSLKKVYEQIPHLRSVIDKKAQLFSNGKMYVYRYDRNGEKVKDEVHPLNKVLSAPNFMQSMKGFLYMSMTYKCIAGDSFIYPKYSVGTRARNITSLWNIDYDDFDILLREYANVLEAENKSDYIKKYQFWINGKIIEFINPDDIIHFRDYGTSYKEGISKISTLREPIQNIYKALKSRGVLASRQGGIGILSSDRKDGGMSAPLSPTEKETLEKKVNNKSITGNRGAIHITDVPLKWQSMVYPTKDLMLFEEIEDDFKTICDAFSVNRELFDGQTNYSNKEHAERGMYQDTIIPEWNEFAGMLTKSLRLDQEQRFVGVDHSHIQVLQEDEREKEESNKVKSDRLLAELERGIIDGNEYKRQMYGK